ncbi:MAG: response regulator, partial [Myxococcota bacterium]
LVNRKVLIGLLEARGHTVTVARDGKEAVDASAREPFDALLVVVEMPEMDGFQATAAIRERERRGARRVPIVAMTAHAIHGYRERCLAAGMDGYVSKPVRPEELYEAVESLAGGAAPLPGAFDRATALGRVGGDPALLRDLARIFLQEGPALLARARDAIARGDAGELRLSAHTLKGSLGFLATDAAAEAAARLETMGRGGKLQGAPEAFQDLERIVGELLLGLSAVAEEGGAHDAGAGR